MPSKFVDYINQHLVAITPARSPDALLDKGGDVRLYLHHCEADSEYAISLAQALQQRELETLLPAFEGPTPRSRVSMVNSCRRAMP